MTSRGSARVDQQPITQRSAVQCAGSAGSAGSAVYTPPPPSAAAADEVSQRGVRREAVGGAYRFVGHFFVLNAAT